MTQAVGFFDGVHLGHQAILRGADEALTFRTHPLALLDPARAPKLIMRLEDRIAAIRACGVREVRVLDFGPQLASLPPAEFAARYLRGHVRCGANWRFGQGGKGDADLLRTLGLDVDVVPYAVFAGLPVSSTRIRAALAAGDLKAANAMMDRAYRMVGRVVAGKGLGRTLGYPTVNVAVRGALLPRGVYAVKVGGVPAIANFGVAPTMGEKAWPEPVLEIHFPDGALPATDAETPVDFIAFIRPERAFPSRDALRAQIAADVAAWRPFALT